jgi:hypothetical protein
MAAPAFEPQPQSIQRRFRGWLLRQQPFNQFFLLYHY